MRSFVDTEPVSTSVRVMLPLEVVERLELCTQTLNSLNVLVSGGELTVSEYIEPILLEFMEEGPCPEVCKKEHQLYQERRDSYERRLLRYNAKIAVAQRIQHRVERNLTHYEKGCRTMATLPPPEPPLKTWVQRTYPNELRVELSLEIALATYKWFCLEDSEDLAGLIQHVLLNNALPLPE